jgi:hypothetical protein
MTYARARLWLGITCIGTQVIVAFTAVMTDLPARWLPSEEAAFTTELLTLGYFFFSLAVLLLPFDIIGGWILPRQFQRTDQSFVSFATKLVRGIGVQLAVFTTVFVLYRLAGTRFGARATVGLFFVVQLTLVAFQLKLACWVGDLQQHRLRASGVNAVSLTSEDSGFTGGIAGFPTSDVVVLPTSWLTALPGRLQNVALLRRQLSIESGRRLFGIVLAIAWNTMSLVAALTLPGAAVTSVAGLVTAYFYFSLFGFAGLLILPTFSRRAVMAVDRLATHSAAASEIGELASSLEELAEGEPSRSASLESVFHPIPCVDRRAKALATREQHTGPAWHVARMALFCAWAFGGPLSRSVHCNIGRPDLWVFLPAD